MRKIIKILFTSFVVVPFLGLISQAIPEIFNESKLIGIICLIFIGYILVELYDSYGVKNKHKPDN